MQYQKSIDLEPTVFFKNWSILNFHSSIFEQFKRKQHFAVNVKTRKSFGNALAENFFLILKTECIHRVELDSYEEASLLIAEYINFYNYYRIQTRTKLTPFEKRSQFIA